MGVGGSFYRIGNAEVSTAKVPDRPVAAARGRQEPGELEINAAILERQVVKKILKHLTLRAAGFADRLQWVRPPKLCQ